MCRESVLTRLANTYPILPDMSGLSLWGVVISILFLNLLMFFCSSNSAVLFCAGVQGLECCAVLEPFPWPLVHLRAIAELPKLNTNE